MAPIKSRCDIFASVVELAAIFAVSAEG